MSSVNIYLAPVNKTGIYSVFIIELTPDVQLSVFTFALCVNFTLTYMVNFVIRCHTIIIFLITSTTVFGIVTIMSLNVIRPGNQ